MMFARRTPSNAVRVGRLDAGFYDPVYVENATTVERHFGDTITNLCPRLLDHSFLSIRTDDYQSAGVPFVRVKNLKGLVLDEDFIFINDEANQRESQTICTPGDLLFAKTGKIAACPVPAHLQQVNTSQDVMVGTVRSGTDPYYVAAYLNCRHGSLYQDRYVQGPVQPHLSLGSLRQIYVVTPPPDAQRYIGDKVRQAERLRERARQLDSLSFTAFDPLTQSLPSPQRAFRVPSSEVEAYRLNPNHFDPVVRAAIHTAKAVARLHPLSDLVVDGDITGGATPLGAQYVTDGIFFARVQNVKPLRLDRSDAAFISADQDREIVRSRCRTDDVVLSITGYPGTASVVLDEDLPLNINQHSVRFAVRSEFGAGYVAAAINSRFGQLQVDRLAVGGTRDALDYTSVRSLLIPEFSIETREAINTQVRIANQCVRAAQRVVALAKLLVEHLIDGRLAEADLVAAQKALESGDRSADRKILKSLRQSEAPDSKPLIPDVDALYSLLDGSEGQDP